MSETMKWPEKTRELHNHHFDSTIWNDLTFRDDDIVIATYAKSGTTWMQQIVAQLMFDGDPDIAVAEMSPWVDLRVPPKEVKLPLLEAQTHRRFMKTHLPVDATRFCPQAKYLYIGRDGRDVVWSMYNHHVNANQTWYDALNNTPGRVGPPIEPPPDTIRQYWREWLDRDGCSGSATSAGKADYDLNVPGAETNRLQYLNCPSGIAVEHWQMTGSGHIPGFTDDFREALPTWLLARTRP